MRFIKESKDAIETMAAWLLIGAAIIYGANYYTNYYYAYRDTQEYAERCRYDVRAKRLGDLGYMFNGWAHIKKRDSTNYVLVAAVLVVEKEDAKETFLNKNWYERKQEDIRNGVSDVPKKGRWRQWIEDQYYYFNGCG